MASSRTTSHIRSFSWPSEPSHPLDSSIEHLLLKLRDSKAGPNSSICHNLCDIKDLYQAINNSIKCPLNQQVLYHQKHRGGVDEALEGSLALLDACGFTTDILSLMKESILELGSSLRRKSGVEEKHIGAYMLSRKKIQKMAHKCLKSFHNLGLEMGGNHPVPVLRMLREAQTISLSALKSVVSYLSSRKAKGMGNSFVAKLIPSKRVSCERQGETSIIEKVDQALLAFEAKKRIMDVEMVQSLLKQFEALELVVQEIEDCLESVSRCLLKIRVSLLNIISH